jgi:hypothetical protein
LVSSSQVALVARSERRALRDLLLAATASAGRNVVDPRLGDLVAAARIGALPAAAALHRVAGCVHDALCGVPGVPPDVMDALAAERGMAARIHLGFSRALVQIGEQWNEAGVPWLVMKGPVLTSMLYRDPGLRSYGDLDLLVARRALPEAVGVLERLGYEHSIKNWPLAHWFVASEFAMSKDGLEVDLHWHLVYAHYDRRYFHIDPQVMLERARTVVVAGRPVTTFDKEDTLVHLAVHASRAGAHRLIWFKDIERSLAVDDPDLDELLRRARQFRCGPSVGLALGRAKALLGADVPDELVAALLGRSLSYVERTVTQLSSPIGFDEDDTLARFVARSMRSDLRTSLADLSRRVLRSARRAVPRRPHETADQLEKEAFLDAVASGRARR